jgi:hypothetical protein
LRVDVVSVRYQGGIGSASARSLVGIVDMYLEGILSDV